MAHILKPHALFDEIKKEFNLKTDADLHRFLEVEAPQISRARNNVCGLSADMTLRVYDKTKWSIEKIRAYLEIKND